MLSPIQFNPGTLMKAFLALTALLSFNVFAADVSINLQVNGADARAMKIEMAKVLFKATNPTCLKLVYGSILATPALKTEYLNATVKIVDADNIILKFSTKYPKDNTCGFQFKSASVALTANSADWNFITFEKGTSKKVDILNPAHKVKISCNGKECTTTSNGVKVPRGFLSAGNTVTLNSKVLDNSAKVKAKLPLSFK